MSLDLGHTTFDDMLKKSAMDFMRKDAPKLVIEDLLETDTGTTEAMWKQFAQLGWLGILIPEQHGGSFHSMTSAGVVMEAFGSGPLPGPYFSSAILGTQILQEAGDEDIEKTWLPALAAGDRVLTLALNEPRYGWRPTVLETRADGGGDTVTISGRKLFVCDAMAATHFIVAANTGSQGPPEASMSLYIVGRETAGVSVRRIPGFLSGRAFEVTFTSVSLPASAMLGKRNRGWQILSAAFMKAIPVLSAYKVGGTQAVFDMSLQYTRDRIQFGRPIGRFQRVQDMIIEMTNHLDAARWATYEALWRQDTGAVDPMAVHLAKALASEGYWQSCTLGHQVFSGLSYSREHRLSHHTRTSRHLYNLLGDPAHHRRRIGEHLLS